MQLFNYCFVSIRQQTGLSTDIDLGGLEPETQFILAEGSTDLLY